VSDLAGIVAFDDALLCEHRDMGLARSDVLAKKVSVDINGGIDVLHDCVGTPREAAPPHFVAHDPLAYETIRSTEAQLTLAPRQSRYDLRRRPLLAIGVVLVVAGSVAAAVYGIGTFKRNAPDGACAGAVETAARLAPLARGELAAFAVAGEALALPDLAFRDANGNERHLSQWRGRTALLNLWATWCVPCRREMPALNALEQRLGGPRFEVVAVNIDTRDSNKPREWLRNTGVDKLGYYADPSAKIFQDLKIIGRAAGMPTTLLVDPAGCELGTIAGPAEWASRDGVELVTAALEK
jgi:thiol-disulfide isomerase/thioredoxin